MTETVTLRFEAGQAALVIGLGLFGYKAREARAVTLPSFQFLGYLGR
jgi:hypothetical protein